MFNESIFLQVSKHNRIKSPKRKKQTDSRSLRKLVSDWSRRYYQRQNIQVCYWNICSLDRELPLFTLEVGPRALFACSEELVRRKNEWTRLGEQHGYETGSCTSTGGECFLWKAVLSTEAHAVKTPELCMRISCLNTQGRHYAGFHVELERYRGNLSLFISQLSILGHLQCDLVNCQILEHLDSEAAQRILLWELHLQFPSADAHFIDFSWETGCCN